MEFIQRINLIYNKLVALFILKLTYNRVFWILLFFPGVIFLVLFVADNKIIYIILSTILIGPCIAVLLMKPFDKILVISRVTGSPHVMIKNKEAIGQCFEEDKLNTILLLKVIRKSMYKFMEYTARHSKRKYIITYTHKIMFRTLGLDKSSFVMDVREITPGMIRDKLLFISFRDILKREDISDLTKKVQYYRFKIDMELLREYLDKDIVGKPVFD